MNFGLELFAAIVSSTAVGSWALWQSSGVFWWKLLTGILVLVTIVKPMLKLQDNIEQATKREVEYHSIYVDSLALAEKVKAGNGFESDSVYANEETLASRLVEAEKKDRSGDFSVATREKWAAVVKTELPKASFWPDSVRVVSDVVKETPVRGDTTITGKTLSAGGRDVAEGTSDESDDPVSGALATVRPPEPFEDK